MVALRTVDPSGPRLEKARRTIEERGIVVPDSGIVRAELIGELLRRGWQPRFAEGLATATKVFTPTGNVAETLEVRDDSPDAALVMLLADAVSFDEASDPSSGRTYQGDLQVHGPDGWPVALVEIKNAKNLTSTVATAFRRNLHNIGLINVRAPFFLLLSQDSGYVWQQIPLSDATEEPVASFSMQEVVAHWLPSLATGERLLNSSLEFLVAGWLSALAFGGGPRPPDPDGTLAQSGFFEALKGTRVVMCDDE